jgi:hypothetical protein
VIVLERDERLKNENEKTDLFVVRCDEHVSRTR